MRQSRFDRHAPAARWRVLAILPFLFTVGGIARAQTTDGDPPDRVARLSYLSGDIGLLPSGAGDWSDASLNRPLTRGDRLAANNDARAEMELDRAALRLEGATDLSVLRLDDQMAQFELTRGTVSLSVRALAPGESYEIDTPRVALVVDQPGTFRIDVDARDGDTEVTAFDGQATVYGADEASRTLIGGHTYRFDDSSLTRVAESYDDSRDAFDMWCADRDRRYADAQSGRYVSEQVIGYQDLDDYGRWQDDDQYGEVWYPSDVSAGWAPYRFGHWAYVAPWGWTWIDDAPWGFAPYHYGRWVYVRDRWGWIPGPRDLHPVYAPALVAFVGGSGWSMSVGSGPPIGWFPLGPGDFYDPWYRVSIGYYRRVNWYGKDWDWDRHRDRDRGGHEASEHYFNERWRRYHEGRDPELRYSHDRPPHGITAMSREAFAQARPVQTHRLHLDAAEARAATILGGASRLPPARAPLAGNRPLPARALDRGSFERPVVMHRPAERQAGERVFRAGEPQVRPAISVPTERRTALPERAPDLPSTRFARGRMDAPSPRPEGERGFRATTLPSVPRFVPAPTSPQPEPSVRREYATPNRPQERALPVPPRFEQVRPAQPDARRWANAEPGAVQAPIARPAPLPAPARFESGRPAMTEAMPPPRRFDPAPRVYAPQPRPQPQPQPQPRQFTPEARPAPVPSSQGAQPSRQPAHRDRENPGAERFQHR